MLFAFITSVMFYSVVIARKGQCYDEDNLDETEIEESVQFMCPDKQYNPLATLIFNTEGGTIR